MLKNFAARVAKLGLNTASASAMVAMSIKAGGALMTLAIFTLAARAMSAEEFGRLAIWFNAIGFLAVAAVFGQDTLIARSFGEYVARNDHAQAWGAYRFGWMLTLASATVSVAAMVVFAPILFACVTESTLLAGAFFLFTQTILHYSSHSTRAVVGFLTSEISRELIWRALLLVVVIWAVFHQGLTLPEFFIAAGVGQLLSFSFAFVRAHHAYRMRETQALSFADRREWLDRGLSMWQSAVFEAASLYVDVMLVGYVASPAAAGHYFAAARIANVFQMVAGGLNTYTIAHSAQSVFFRPEGKASRHPSVSGVDIDGHALAGARADLCLWRRAIDDLRRSLRRRLSDAHDPCNRLFSHVRLRFGSCSLADDRS